MPLRSCSNNPDLVFSEVPADAARILPRGSAGTHVEPTLARIVASLRRAPDVLLSVIGGNDERRVELRVKEPPWRMICSLEIETARGAFRGTGWLAGPRTVITSGHCVHHVQEFGGWATAMVISPGRTWREQSFGPYRATRFSCSEQWLAQEKVEADIGCVHLDEPVGDTLGWFAYAAPDPATLQTSEVIVSGYPEFSDSYDNLCTASGRVRALRTSRLFYEADTSDGQSGSPVWNASDSETLRKVIAIHSYEKEATPADIPETNSATLITADIQELITRWQNPRQP